MGIKIVIEVDDTTSYTLIEEDNLIEGLEIARKLDSDVTQLMASVECGECNVGLCNIHNDFTTINSAAKYKNIKNGQKVVVFQDDTQLFTGYIVDFKAPTTREEQTCSLRIVDRLYSVLNSDLTLADMQISSKTTAKAYISTIFKLLKIPSDEWVIEESLSNFNLNYTLIKGYKVADQLDELSKALDAYFYVDASGVIHIEPKTVSGESTLTIERDVPESCLEKSEFGASVFSSYSTLKVGYTTTKLSEVKELYNVKDQEVKVGINSFENCELKTKNLFELDNVKVSSLKGSFVTELSSTSSTVSMKLENPTDEVDAVSISVCGKEVELSSNFITKELETTEVSQVLEVSSILIQQKKYAQALAESLFSRASEKTPYIQVEVSDVEGFKLDLGSVVTVIDSDVDFTYTGYVHSFTAEYTGIGDFYYTLGIKKVGE